MVVELKPSYINDFYSLDPSDKCRALLELGLLTIEIVEDQYKSSLLIRRPDLAAGISQMMITKRVQEKLGMTKEEIADWEFKDSIRKTTTTTLKPDGLH